MFKKYFSRHSQSLRMACRSLIACWMLAFILAPVPGYSEPPPREYVLKAGFIYNFTKFITWPDIALNKNNFRICIYGKDPFGSILDKLAESKQIKGKPIQIQRQTQLGQLSSCHIVFLAQSRSSQMDQILKAIKGHPVLLIGDSNGLASRGAGINLLVLDNKIKFEINSKAISKSGLRISSELLQLGILIEEGK